MPAIACEGRQDSDLSPHAIPDGIDLCEAGEPDALDDGQRIWELESTANLGVCGMFFTIDGGTLIIVTIRFGISIFDVAQVKHLKSFKPFDMGKLRQDRTPEILLPTSMSPDGHLLAIVGPRFVCDERSISNTYVVDVVRCEVVYEHHVDEPLRPAFSSDGRFLAFCNGDVVSTATWTPIVTNRATAAVYNRCQPEGAARYVDDTPRDDPDDRSRRVLKLAGICWSKDNHLLSLTQASCLETPISLNGVVAGSERFTEMNEFSCLTNPTYSNDDKKLYFYSLGVVEVYDRQSMTAIGRFTDSKDVAVESPDSLYVALAIYRSPGVRIWNPQNFTVVGCIRQAALQLVWWPDSSKLVVGGSTCLVWDKRGGSLPEHRKLDAYTISVSSRNSRVLVVGQWVVTYKPASLLPQKLYGTVRAMSVTTVTFSRAGSREYFAVKSNDGVQFADAETGDVVAQIMNRDVEAVFALKLSADFVHVVCERWDTSIVIHRIDGTRVRRLGSYTFENLRHLRWGGKKFADGPLDTVVVAIRNQLRLISFQNQQSSMEDAVLEHTGTLHLDHYICSVQTCAVGHEEIRIAVVHRTSSLKNHCIGRAERGDIIRIYQVDSQKLSVMHGADGKNSLETVREVETVREDEAFEPPDNAKQSVIFEMTADEVLEGLFVQADKVREQYPDYTQWQRVDENGETKKWIMAFDTLLFDESNGTTFACLMSAVIDDAYEPVGFDFLRIPEDHWAIVWVDLVHKKTRVLRIPEGVTVRSLAGNSILSTLTILTTDELLTIADVDVDATDLILGGHLALEGDQQTFSLSSCDAASRTITMPLVPGLHWDNASRRWLEKEEEVAEFEKRRVDLLGDADRNAGLGLDPFENAHFPHFQRRVTSKNPCFFRDCKAKDVEQVKELSQL